MPVTALLIMALPPPVCCSPGTPHRIQQRHCQSPLPDPSLLQEGADRQGRRGSKSEASVACLFLCPSGPAPLLRRREVATSLPPPPVARASKAQRGSRDGCVELAAGRRVKGRVGRPTGREIGERAQGRTPAATSRTGGRGHRQTQWGWGRDQSNGSVRTRAYYEYWKPSAVGEGGGSQAGAPVGPR